MQSKGAPRRRHSEELKTQVLAACAEPGASIAAIAQAHGLNANLVHKWRRGPARALQRSVAAAKATSAADPRVGVFVPLQLPAPPIAPTPDIRIELRRGATSVTVTWPGEQAQVDWGHFGHLQIGRARRPLMAFVMVLSRSRMVFLHFFLDARIDSFLRGHALAFIAFGGVPRVLLYDNLESAVLERQGDAIRFNPTLLALAGHYRFEPRPVAVARGNEKGRVERAIRYIRDSFFAGRTFTDLDDLNAQAAQWCRAQAADRRWVEDISSSVRQAFEAERGKLLALPQHEFALGERVAVTVGKTPYVRFDLNDYSVPHNSAQLNLALLGLSLIRPVAVLLEGPGRQRCFWAKRRPRRLRRRRSIRKRGNGA